MQALSALNFRDLGGIRAAGGRIRPGLLFRSEGPSAYGPAHREELDAIGFRLVCDLRSTGERDRSPNQWHGEARLYHLAMADALRDQANAGWTRLRETPSPENARAAMLINYRALPESLAPHLAELTDLMLDGHVPAMVHCAAGKDRTGVAIAMLLLIVGVPEKDVYADYMRSARFGESERGRDKVRRGLKKLIGRPAAEDVVTQIVGVEHVYLDTALDAVRETHGSLEAYFDSAGMDAERRAALTRLLVEPA